MKKIIEFLKKEKSFLLLWCFVMFLIFNMVRANNTIFELKEENQALIEMVDNYIPTAEEND